MSRRSHKHYLLLLCLRVGPTSGAKIARLSVSSSPDYCEQGGVGRRCSVISSHLEMVALVCQREEEETSGTRGPGKENK